MRLWLITVFFLLCGLPGAFTGAAVGAASLADAAHPPTLSPPAMGEPGAAGTLGNAADGDCANACHAHCAMALLAPPVLHNRPALTRLHGVLTAWPASIPLDRPERPRWAALA